MKGSSHAFELKVTGSGKLRCYGDVGKSGKIEFKKAVKGGGQRRRKVVTWDNNVGS